MIGKARWCLKLPTMIKEIESIQFVQKFASSPFIILMDKQIARLIYLDHVGTHLQCLIRRASLTADDAFAILKADSIGDYITYSGFCDALRQVCSCVFLFIIITIFFCQNYYYYYMLVIWPKKKKIVTFPCKDIFMCSCVSLQLCNFAA